MKKGKTKGACSIVLIITLMSMLLQVYVLADYTTFKAAMDAIPANEIPNLVTVAEDNFNAVDDTDILAYTGGTGWLADSRWTGVTADPVANYIRIINNEFIQQSKGVSGVKAGSYNLYRTLLDSNYIDLDQDMDYYITFRIPASGNAGAASSQVINFQNSSNNVLFSAGMSRNHGVNNMAVMQNLGNGPTSRVGVGAGGNYTFLVYLGTRASERDICKVKLFNEDTDTFTYTPLTWDSEGSNTKTGVITNIGLKASNGTGSDFIANFDDISIKKSTPVMVNKSSDFIAHAPVVGETSSITVAPTNILGNNQTVNSIEWFEYINGTHQTLQTGITDPYTVDSIMLSRLLRCKVVVTDDVTGISSAYWPVSGYVRDQIDVQSILFTNSSNNGSIRTDAEGNLYDNSAVKVYGYVSKNTASEKTVEPILAIYDVNNELKSIDTQGVRTFGGTGGIGSIYTYSWTFTTNTFETGDYIKVFLWDSIDGIQPLNANLSSPSGSIMFPDYGTTTGYPQF